MSKFIIHIWILAFPCCFKLKLVKVRFHRKRRTTGVFIHLLCNSTTIPLLGVDGLFAGLFIHQLPIQSGRSIFPAL